MRVERKDAHGNAIDFTGLLQIGRLGACMKNNRVDDLHVRRRSNEGANRSVYETLEMLYQGFAEGENRKCVAVKSRESRQPGGVFLITI
jgi:hypothetical protein